MLNRLLHRSNRVHLQAWKRSSTVTRAVAGRMTRSMGNKGDPTSLANFSDIRVTHSDYALDVLFSSKTIEGYAALTAQVEAADGASELVLDTSSGLAIHKVELLAPADSGSDATKSAPAPALQALQHEWGTEHKVLGKPLHVKLPSTLPHGSSVRVGIRFTTSQASSALQWLAPAQTAGGSHPYLFSQCQAIHARALVPCQDSPGAKMSYTATVRVPAALTALMSAVPLDANPLGESFLSAHLSDVPHAQPTRTFHFNQKVPIPPYLIALAVGELASRDLSPRTRVWSEPSMVEAGAYEFAETARFLEAGEAIAGEYVWGRYDLLLLPPSFPYGGMENPCLTFVTPTLLAGDRSLTNVVAHEIAHSWTGNLVTNASWEHFWCNEGFTVLLERKILGRLHGDTMYAFHAAKGAIDMAGDIERFGESHPYTRLVPDMSGGVDPDDVFSKIPYEKGFYFLHYLQTLVGGASVFDPFLRSYLTKFAYKTVTSEEFRSFFLDHFKDVEAVKQVDWDTWFYAPGMPPVTNEYDTTLATKAYDLAKSWHTSDLMGVGSAGPSGAGPQDVEGWSSEQVVAFLDKLGEYRGTQPMHASLTSKMAELYGLLRTKNSEIRAAFFRLAIAAEDTSVLPAVLEMLTTQGRMKFLRPLYRSLHKSKMGNKVAAETFKKHRDSYHPIAAKMIAADLGV